MIKYILKGHIDSWRTISKDNQPITIITSKENILSLLPRAIRLYDSSVDDNAINDNTFPCIHLPSVY